MINAIGSQQSLFRYSQPKLRSSNEVTFGSSPKMDKILDKVSPKSLLNLAIAGIGAGGLVTAGAGIMGFVKQAFEPFDAGLSALSSVGVLVGSLLVGGAIYALRLFRSFGYPGE